MIKAIKRKASEYQDFLTERSYLKGLREKKIEIKENNKEKSAEKECCEKS